MALSLVKLATSYYSNWNKEAIITRIGHKQMTSFHYTQLYSTYSIVARDPKTGQFGVAVQTHQMSVGRVVPWLECNLGAVATQSLTNISFGPMALAMLRENVPAEQVISALVASDPNSHRRQVAVVDSQGRAAAFTGDGCIAEAGHYAGDGYSVQANMMTNKTVIDAMRQAYESTKGDLASRMLAVMQAAQAEDGDIRGMQSAALKVTEAGADRRSWETEYDLRVDEHENPVEELARLVRMRQAQLMDAEGHRLLEAGDATKALKIWKKARDKAPELEELAFWQAVAFADASLQPNSESIAARILELAMENEPRQQQWLELLHRLEACGLIENQGTAENLIRALEEA